MDFFAHPIFSKEGDFPESIKEQIKKLSKLEGRSTSRLPSFSAAEVEEIRGNANN